MTAPIEDVSSLPGKKISDQAETPIGEVKQIFGTDDGYPMWVAVELSAGIGDKRTALVPLARIKDEGGELRVPYSKRRIGEAPEVEDVEELETTDADTRTEESRERLHDPGSAEIRHVSAEDVAQDTQGDQDDRGDGR